jgi:uncharacterized protein (DUF433 family)
MDWQDRISIHPNILVGKPVIKGTRISVELVIDMLGSDWSFEDILRNYPHITREDIIACLKYAGATLSAEKIFPVPA